MTRLAGPALQHESSRVSALSQPAEFSRPGFNGLASECLAPVATVFTNDHQLRPFPCTAFLAFTPICIKRSVSVCLVGKLIALTARLSVPATGFFVANGHGPSSHASLSNDVSIPRPVAIAAVLPPWYTGYQRGQHWVPAREDDKHVGTHYRAKVLEYLRAHPGRELAKGPMAKALHLQPVQITRAMYSLVNGKDIQAVQRGVWKYVPSAAQPESNGARSVDPAELINLTIEGPSFEPGDKFEFVGETRLGSMVRFSKTNRLYTLKEA